MRLVITCAALAMAASCGGDGGGDASRLDIDLTGCAEGASGVSLLVRVEGVDDNNAECRADEVCLPTTLSAATPDEIEDALRSQGFPLFDLPANSVRRITVAVSGTTGCALGFLTTACGSTPITAGASVATIDLNCSVQPACADITDDCPATRMLEPDAPMSRLELGRQSD